jgi:hypothetical protein
MGRIWSSEEDDTLTRLVGIHGKQWGIISSQMVNRSPSQIAARWEKCIDPKLTKGPFTPEEDQIILDYVEKYGPKNWPALSDILVQRSPKQCRERWLNHLSPGISSVPWTNEEDLIIFDQYSKIGGRWSLIARFLPGRTDNSIKNRWNSSISKRIQTDSCGRRVLGPDYAKKANPPIRKPVGKPPPIRTLPPMPGPTAGGAPVADEEQYGRVYTPTMGLVSPFHNEMGIGSPFAAGFGVISPIAAILSPSTPQGLFGGLATSHPRGILQGDLSESGQRENKWRRQDNLSD